MMAQMYPLVDFGPENIPQQDTDDMDDDELVLYKRKVERLEKQKKDGYARIKAKVKELRSGYKVAIDKGTRSGSGRLICDNFDKLQKIWGGSPSVSSLPNAQCTQSLPHEENDEIEANDLEETDATDKITPTPHDVRDNKRDHMQKKLSAHQRDMMQVDLTREEIALKKEAIDIMRENARSTEEAINSMTNSISNIGDSIKEGLALLAQSMIQCQQMSMLPNNFTNFLQPNPINQTIMQPNPTNNDNFITLPPSQQ